MNEQINRLQAHLQESRAVLWQTLTSLDEAQWQTVVFSEGDVWTAADLLRHLVYAQRGMTGLISQIRDGGFGVPEDFDLDRWNASGVRKQQALAPADLMATLQAEREAVLRLLASMDEDTFAKRGRHGSGQIMSIAEIFELIGDHELLHNQDLRTAVGISA